MILLFFAALIVFFLALGLLTRGTGADLLDWDPRGRVRARIAADAEDVDDLLELVNRERREKGLPELTHHEVLQDHQPTD